MGTYLELTDTPGSYSGKGSQVVAVKSAEDGLEFVESGDQGPQGPQGYMGEQGATGLGGAQGAQGPYGVQGDQGNQGWMGVQGPSGIGAGDQGYQGDQGDQGETGPQGTQGVTGDQGNQGYQGTQGFQGLTGDQGEIGDTGAQGPRGYQGYQGFQGLTGDQGEIGETGDQGLQGEQGAATFLELTDAPASYSGEQDKFVSVKGAQDGLEFVASPIPIGVIIPYLGGYFTDGVNGGFTMMMAVANSVASLNTLLNGDGWYVCNGAALNLGGSPIFDGAGRYLPKLTDDRFIMGDTLGGTPGGNNAMAHTHPSGTLGTDTEANHGHGDNFSVSNHTLTKAQMPAHSHKFYIKRISSWADNNRDVPSATAGTWFATNSQGGNEGHNHGLGGAVSAGGSHSHSVNSGATGAASVTENRPKFLGCFYIMRVI